MTHNTLQHTHSGSHWLVHQLDPLTLVTARSNQISNFVYRRHQPGGISVKLYGFSASDATTHSIHRSVPFSKLSWKILLGMKRKAPFAYTSALLIQSHGLDGLPSYLLVII